MAFRFALATALMMSCAPAFAQNATARPPEAHPDFQGAWTSSFITPLERIPGTQTLVISDAEARTIGENLFQQSLARESGLDPDVIAGDVRALLRIGDGYRTSIIVDPPDGKLPLRPEARAHLEAFRRAVPDSPDDPEQRNNLERCIAGHGQTPFTLTPTINPRQIVQTPDYLMIYTEDGLDTRIIPLSAAGSTSDLAQWGGRSRGHWDGAELTIETTRVKASVRGGVQGTFPLSDSATIVERMSFASPDALLYRYTVTDPTNYSTPWTGEFLLTRSATAAREYACHEGNLSMHHMLLAARMEEARTAGAEPPK